MTHTCHAKRCNKSCAPRYLMCRDHWNMVPHELQQLVYKTYRPSQRATNLPSKGWHQAADASIASVALQEGCPFDKLRVPEVRALLALAPGMCPEGTDERLKQIAATKKNIRESKK
jgi:hypothetical protein